MSTPGRPGPAVRIARKDRRAWRAAALLGLAAVVVGCAASNYLDAQGPLYAGRFAGTTPPADGLRVVTFNIAHARHIPRAIAALREQAPLRRPDILALQEMDADGTRAIAQALSLDYVYYPASTGPGETGDMGEAVLSPWPIEDSWKVPLPHRTRVVHRSRSAVAVRIRLAGLPITAYSVHYGSVWGLGPGARRDQARAVLADAQRQDGPVIVAGDFNSKGVSRVFEDAGFVWVTRDVGGTAGPFALDHIVARGLVPVAGQAAGVVREVRGVSDHHPVWALFELPRRAD